MADLVTLHEVKEHIDILDEDQYDALLNDLIDAAPDESKPRLRGLMFKMEGESRRSKSQLGYNLRLSSMMMEMLDELREQLYLLSVGDISEIEKASMRPSGAEVIPFERAAGKNE